MSCAGIWSTAPLNPNVAARMLNAFVPGGLAVLTRSDDAAHVRAAASGAPPALEEPHPSGAWLSGDLRLDALAELAESLGVAAAQRGARWLVVEAYQRWGLEFASRLYGDFGFALWDPERRRLVLARDPGGSRPIFYATSGVRVAYASHPRGLLCLDSVPRTLDQRAVLDHLGELPQEEAATLFAAVRRLPPACLLAVGESGHRVEQYVDITQTPERRLGSDGEYATALREELARAVTSRSSGPSAVMLSGGLDSSAVAALAQRSRGEGAAIVTISAVFPGFSECDERPYQAAVVSRIASNHHEVRPDPLSSAGDFGRLCQVFSEPSFIGPHWLTWASAEVAVREGARCVLTGIDGDRVVSHGGGRFADLAREHEWRALARELAAVDDFGWPRRVRVFGAQALFALLPERVSASLDRIDPRRARRFAPQLALLRPELLRRHGVMERLASLPLRPRSTREEHSRILQAPDRNWDVELLDQVGTAFGLRFQQPFFDRRVMELCFSFPGSQKRQAGWSRYVLRNALRGLVPESVLERRRDASFDRPYWAWARAWLLAHPAPDGWLEALAPYVDAARVAKLLARLPEEPDQGPVDVLWRCVILSRWLHGPGLPQPESFRTPVQPMDSWRRN